MFCHVLIYVLCEPETALYIRHVDQQQLLHVVYQAHICMGASLSWVVCSFSWVSCSIRSYSCVCCGADCMVLEARGNSRVADKLPLPS